MSTLHNLLLLTARWRDTYAAEFAKDDESGQRDYDVIHEAEDSAVDIVTGQHSTLAETWMSLEALANVFGDEMTADHVGSRFTCTEANIIAEALIIGGFRDAAIAWLSGHAFGDEYPDTDMHIGADGLPLDMVAYVDTELIG